LDPLKQWQHIQININSFPFLLKQLKRCGLVENILVTTYKSLVLSHFNYSSTFLDSATAGTKQDMQSFQNRILQIIGIAKETSKPKYNIVDIADLIEKNRFKQVSRILSNKDNE
jgi:hypothetical protein